MHGGVVSSVRLATVALAVFGCGGGGSEPDAAPADAPGGQEVASGPFCSNHQAVPSLTDLTGTWVARMVGAQIVFSPVGSIHIESVAYQLLTLRQDGQDIAVDGRNCDRTEIDPPGALVPVIVPPAWAHTEKPVHRRGSFAPGIDGVPVLTLPPYVENAGAVLAPGDTTLPTQASDPRVIDEDGDGNPGITVVLNGQSISGSLFSVQQQTTAVSAIPVASNRLEGALSYTSAQNVLDSNPSSIASLYKLSTTASDPVLCNSSFDMVRVSEGPVDGGGGDDGGVAIDGGTGPSCEWVRDNEAVLFPQ
jgi:hypothetical protein